MATRLRSLQSEYVAAGSMIPYYEAVGDERSAGIMRFHRHLMVLEMLKRYQARQSSVQREGLELYGLLAPESVTNNRLVEQVKSVQRAQQKAVLYASKAPGRAPTAALFWTRQGRTDVRIDALELGRQRVSLCAGSLHLQQELGSGQHGIIHGKSATQVMLHSGRVLTELPTTPDEALFVPDERHVALVVGATAIQAWSETAHNDEAFEGIARRLAMYIDRHGITNTASFDDSARHA